MNYEAIILRKTNELQYAKRRLQCALDDYNQYLFCPDYASSEMELKQYVLKWEQHILNLKADILSYNQKNNQQSLKWGPE